MKKIKLLTPILGITAMAGAVAPLTSCGCSSGQEQTNHIEKGETDIKIVGNEVYNYMLFTLNESLKDGQTLTTDLVKTDYFTFGNPTIENKLVSIPVVWSQETAIKSITETKNIKFTCTNSDGTVAWEQTINDCKMTYSPNIILTSESKAISTNASGKKLTQVFTFELGEELEEILTLKPWFTDVKDVNSGSKTDYTIDQDECSIEVDGTSVTLTVVAEKTSDVVEGDGVQFDLQIECVASDTWTYWQSTKFTGLTINYQNEEIALDERCFETDTESDGSITITGINTESEYYSDKANTFLIPAKTDDKWYRYIGNGEKVNLPKNITKIKIGGIGVQEIRANAFYGNENIKYIDFEAIDDSVKSLDTVLVFDTNSFGGWNDEGAIVWNKDISQYKRHIVKEKLYKAGLTNSKWFGFTDVNNLSALKEAAYIGGNIRLTGNIQITPDEEYNGQINFYTSSILDLNGYTIEVVDRPIFNSLTKEFAVIGVWDCELVVTDSLAEDDPATGRKAHGGSIKAFDNSAINTTTKPTDTTGENADNQWEWETNRGEGKADRYRSRENRTFYVRSDIPTRSKGTLEILAGNFYGNCTTIMNWNTTVYVEDEYSEYPTTKEEYVGEYAPTFHLYSKYYGDNNKTTDIPTWEILNCENTTSTTGEATFQFWGGKLMGYEKLKDGAPVTGDYFYYDPETNGADKVPNAEGTLVNANWSLYKGWDTSNRFSTAKIDTTNHWTLLVPNEWE